MHDAQRKYSVELRASCAEGSGGLGEEHMEYTAKGPAPPYMCPVGVWEAQESRSFKTVHHFEHVLWEKAWLVPRL